MSDAPSPIEPTSSLAFTDVVAADDFNESAPPAIRSWGPWATMGWALLITVVASGVVYLLWKGFLLIAGPGLDRQQLSNHYYGLINLLFVCVGAALLWAALVMLIRLKGRRFAEYIRLTRVKTSCYLYAMMAIVVFIVLQMLFSYLMQHSPPSWLFDVWATRGSLLFLLFVMVIAGPLAEEIFYRGFLFRGLAGTRFGPSLPIIVTALMWALMHQQYGWVEIAIIFFNGLLLGYVRHRTNSITPTILMHMTMNFVSCVLFMIFHT